MGVDVKGTTKEDWDSSQEMTQNGLIPFVYIELAHQLRLDVYLIVYIVSLEGCFCMQCTYWLWMWTLFLNHSWMFILFF